MEFSKNSFNDAKWFMFHFLRPPANELYGRDSAGLLGSGWLMTISWEILGYFLTLSLKSRSPKRFVCKVYFRNQKR
jgi:hypothetical protein